MIPIKIPLEQKQIVAESLQDYANHELDLNIGSIAAEGLLDHLITQLAPYLYNKGIEDAISLLSQCMAQAEEDLHSLKRPLR
ncbi:DUF2164 domain-containing protein [Paenibacillus pasadenensis]|uniref:DUF2164 domain-containing protein n=1 Tax=Paenibacillus pasadenensis TaxID=217090 RepID=UPI00203BD5FA|nr:DUF2164 domain-containing protein [Paenibacillus pasadenensis]MCM3746902.1 DUF2164 domain-containing protein [Paenibacillus pasadenensis]